MKNIKVLPLSKKLERKIDRFGLRNKWNKQIKLFKNNPSYPSLNLELLEPRKMGIYSFRIDRKFRSLLFFRNKNLVEIINITVHYH